MNGSSPLDRSNSADFPLSSEASEGSGRPLWRNRTFVWILSGNTIAVFGDSFNGIALSLWVLQTTGSAKRMAAVQICYMVISILFASFAGTVADRLDRRKLMLLSDLLRGSVAVTLAICLFFLHAPFWIILVLISVSAFANLFQAPSFHASVTHLAGSGKVAQATSAVHLTDNIARISGLGLGGVVVAAFGGFTAMAFTAVTFFLSAICVVAAGVFPRSARGPQQDRKASFFKDWKVGLALIVKEPLTRAIIVLNPLLILFFMSSLMLVQVVAVRDWRASPTAFGLIEMCVPLGYMIGAGIIMAFGARMGRRGLWVFAGFISLGPAFYLISIMDTAAPALPVILSAGILFAFCSMILQIILRSEVGQEMQGRVYGTMVALTNVAPPVGLAITSVLADEWGAKAVLGATGWCLFGAGLLAAMLFKPIRSYW